MKIKLPQPFTFEAGERAVLLLHGFTGHSADVRMLGRFLEKKGYTSHAPIYRGHGLPPEELIKSNPDQWWADVKAAFDHLKELGYQEIAVAGLSLGGVLGLKLAYSEKIKGMVTMCAPMFFDNEEKLTKGFREFSKEFKQLEQKDETVIKEELDTIMDQSKNLFEGVRDTVNEVKSNIDMIYTPTFVVQAEKDEMINPDSANYIYDNVESTQKDMKWYANSGHVITMDKEKDQLHEDIYRFLESLDWEV
ncbi:alpha/beta hydrolase [Oceanobacillus jeddahense]|uniref:Alpha/beta fold hydrolase n=1 Tax=Oceanobacillus jeddahense TaxID=1462527 RepID=A0ABY5JT26_9BACI|nr:alpha/beta fold hydrolase [Oceanobacillus jeddahense]UUI02032.1 alpha/beta fold hydrolase [Oceanobacillus jeddahense]